MNLKERKRYINTQNAMRVSGLSYSALLYHARAENIRTIRVGNWGYGRRGEYYYHIDDARALSWATARVIAQALLPDCNPVYFSRLLDRFKITGAVEIGSRRLYPPEMVPKIVDWYRRGRPVTVHFRPKNEEVMSS